jgi:hypothetical protein
VGTNTEFNAKLTAKGFEKRHGNKGVLFLGIAVREVGSSAFT